MHTHPPEVAQQRNNFSRKLNLNPHPLCFSRQVGGLLKDGLTAKGACPSIYDGKQFAVQLLPAPESVNPDETLLLLQVSVGTS